MLHICYNRLYLVGVLITYFKYQTRKNSIFHPCESKQKNCNKHCWVYFTLCSYHAYVFSFLFKVPAVYIDDCSLDMSSRIESFIQTMGIYQNTLDNIRNDDIILPTSAHYMILDEERKKFSEYISKSLEEI